MFQSLECILSLAYIAHISEVLNILTHQLQGKNITKISHSDINWHTSAVEVWHPEKKHDIVFQSVGNYEQKKKTQ